MTATSSTISADLASLDAHLASLQEQADSLALAVVDGDQEATGEIARLLAEIGRVQSERPILARAQGMALRREAGAAEEADAATRAGHMNDAREIATRIVSAGQRADVMIASFVALMAEIDADEKAAHRSLRAAGEPLSVGQHGRHGIVAIFAERMSAAASFKIGRLSDQRPLMDTLSAAWDDLAMENEND